MRQIAARINEISKTLNHQNLVLSLNENESSFFNNSLDDEFINSKQIFLQYNLNAQIFKKTHFILGGKIHTYTLIISNINSEKENTLDVKFPFKLIKQKLANNAKNLI